MAAITMLGLPTINLRRRRILMRSRCQILLVIFSTLLLLVVVVVMLISPSSATRLTRARAQTEAQRRQARQLSSAQPSRRISENKTLTTAINSTHKPLDDNTIRNAVHDWVTKTNKDDVIATYGHISDWDVSQVTGTNIWFGNAFMHIIIFFNRLYIIMR